MRDLLQESFSKHIQGQPVSLELPNDERLVTQLTQRKYRMTSKGKIALERKEDMKKTRTGFPGQGGCSRFGVRAAGARGRILPEPKMKGGLIHAMAIWR